jgi:hypothetical protein
MPHLQRRQLVAVFLAIVTLGATACGGAGQLATPTSAPAPQSAGPLAAKAAPAAAPQAQPESVAPGAPAQAGIAQRQASTPDSTPNLDAATQPFDRMVIRNVQLSLEVGDIQAAISQATEIARSGGGFISGSNVRTEKSGDQERMVADLTLQVRSDSLDSTLVALRGLGKVQSESGNSQDVTEEYVDLDSNLRNLQASESAILKLMDKATRIEDVLALQRELTTVRGQIERIQGRKRFLERRSDMATISLALRLPPVETAKPLTGGWDPVAVFLRGWQASLGLLRGVAEVLITAAGFSWWLIPFVALGVYLWQQRRARRQPPTPEPA